MNTRTKAIVDNIKRVLTGLLLVSVCSSTLGTELNIAVAANFKATINKLIPLYEQATGDTIHISAGSSGKLATQIIHGAPYDIFLSADEDRPAMLIAQHSALANSLFSYATGTLVLWQPDGNLPTMPYKAFNIGSTGRIGLANPRHAPYGIAAQEVLRAMNLWDKLSQERRLAFAGSASQAWQYAASGNVKAAFVPLSHVIQAQDIAQNTEASPSVAAGTYWSPPKQWYSPIIQQGVILTSSSNQIAARRFCNWLRTDATAIQVIINSGYQTTFQQPNS